MRFKELIIKTMMDIHRNDLLKLAMFYDVDIDDYFSDKDLIYYIGKQLEDIEINDPLPTIFEGFDNLSSEKAQRNKMLDFAKYYCIQNADKMTNDEIQIEINKESDKVFFDDFYYLKYKKEGKNIDRDVWLYNRAFDRMKLEVENFKQREIERYKSMKTFKKIAGPARYDAILTYINIHKDISESAGDEYKTLQDIKKAYGLSHTGFFHNIYKKIIKYKYCS